MNNITLTQIFFLSSEECDLSSSTAVNESAEGTDSAGVTGNDDLLVNLPHRLGVTKSSEGSPYDDLSDITDHDYDAIFQMKSLKISVHDNNDVINYVTTEVTHAGPEVRDPLSDPLSLGGRQGGGQRDDASLDPSRTNRHYKDNVAYGRGGGPKAEKEVKGARIDVWEFDDERKDMVHFHLLNAGGGRIVNSRNTIAVLLLTVLLQMTGLR